MSRADLALRVVETEDEVTRLRREVERLRDELLDTVRRAADVAAALADVRKQHDSCSRGRWSGLDEALNSGDGVYRP